MGKEVSIEPAEGEKHICFNEHTGPCSPEDLYAVVILAFVFLYGAEDPSPAEGKAILVNESSCSACIFEILFVLVRFDLRLADGYVCVIVHQRNHGVNPA